MKKMIAIVTKHTDGRLSTNPENGSFQNRPQVILVGIAILHFRLISILVHIGQQRE